MNRKALSIALALVVAVVGLASAACNPSADTNSSLTTNRNAAPAPEPVNTAAIEAELKKLEQDWSNSFKTKDVATVRRILADDIVLTYPDGSTGTKNDEVQMAETGAFSADSWEVAESKVTVLDAEAAYMTGRTIVKNAKLKDPKSGKTIDISGEYRFLDVYAKRKGTWQAVASQVTKIQAPPTPTKAAQN
jgi:ketosteroid isomerase-like protein